MEAETQANAARLYSSGVNPEGSLLPCFACTLGPFCYPPNLTTPAVRLGVGVPGSL